ncbi:HEAT repeat domain-containing protein [Halanaerobacter jeridensis]|uniref:HEAT repeat protein n=1 Tax=Halanaerobacter jeridensis TaxID=706427 RepID=A0A939BS92_9FIRM|nr:hypothetical protein [Halanaerobacter jeridensis]MBM7558114.1 hypothetical protein [Halanaerobacter jeridensis]
MFKEKSENIFKTNKVQSFIDEFAEKNSDDILQKIKNEKKISSIPDGFELLLCSNTDLKLEIAKILNEAVNSLSPLHLKRLDSLFRERTSLEWSYDWAEESPNNLLESSMTKKERVTILGLCSFHPNGYFREKAVEELANFSTGNEFSYFLIRLNDWVEIIREKVIDKVKNYINSINTKVVIDNLPLIFHLRKCKRYDHSNIINEIISIFSNEEAYSKLKRGFNSDDEKIRRYCYKIAIEKEIFNNKEIIDYILTDLSAYNRLFAIRKLKERVSLKDFEYFIQSFLSDNYAPIRKKILEIFYKFDPQKSIKRLKEALLDENGSVREIARYFLRKHCNYDFKSFYRSILKNEDICIGAIYGIGETGNSDDTRYISSFLNHDKVSIVKAAIYSLAKLNFEEYKDQFILLLADERPGVSKQAKIVLQDKIYKSDAKRIYKIFNKNKMTHIKRNTASLICSVKNKWEVLIYILEICTNNNDKISNVGYSALSRWKRKCNEIFVSPTKNQILNLEKALNDYGDSIEKEDKNLIEYHLGFFK